MKNIRFLDRRAVNVTLAFAMLLGVIAPALSPVGVGAAGLVTSRKIEMSNSGVSATGVDYKLTFTPTSDAGAVVIDFCNDSPIIGQACVAPAGLSFASVTSSPSGVTASGNNLQLVTSMTNATPKVITFSGIVNPNYITDTTANHGFYARVVTYVDGADVTANYVDEDTLGTYIDAGGIALAVTNPIEVSAAVRETMTFCVSKLAPGPSCGLTGQAVTVPSLVLGHGTPKALDATETNTDTSYAQISTNAATGAVVNMKIGNTCGGLARAAAPTVCNIAPSTSSSVITPGASALFGLNVGDEVASGTGFGGITSGAPYNTTSQYGMDWVSGNATGVGSTYGDEIFNTESGPVSNQNVPLTFGATVTPNTPAGLYQASLSLIASGTY